MNVMAKFVAGISDTLATNVILHARTEFVVQITALSGGGVRIIRGTAARGAGSGELSSLGMEQQKVAPPSTTPSPQARPPCR